jgi:hypothetical protein
MSLNPKAGKAIINLESASNTSLLVDSKQPPNEDYSSEIQAVLSTAERNIDHRNVKRKRSKKEIAIQRTYQITLVNVQRMEKLNELQGADFSWQINRALEHWFSTLHPEIQIHKAQL